MKVGITGAHGFLGWHMRCFLHAQGVDADIMLAGRDVFADSGKLAEFVRDADVIFHLAGVNRASSDDEVREQNPRIAKLLIEALESEGATPHVIYSSTTHVDGDSPYGQGKAEAAQLLGEWAKRNEAPFTSIVFPHLYGENGRPFYNSVVHTFCHQLASGEALSVNGDGRLELLHAQDAVEYAWMAWREKHFGELRPSGRKMSVAELADKLTWLHEAYVSGVVPDLRNREDRKLFNVLRTAMFPSHYPRAVKRNEDPRGWLFEAIREDNGGQVFISSTNPGFTRGNHYHRFKVERFCVLSGQAVIRIRRLFSDEVHEFNVSGDEPCFIDMPPLHTHSISNEGEGDVITLFWANEFFDPDNPDTYRESVLNETDNK